MSMELLDATLREGEQRSGQSFSVEQKVSAAETLDSMGVEYIQIGFPIANDGTAEACSCLDTDADLVGMCRAIERDIDAAIEAGVDIIDLGVPTSDIQRENILGVNQSELIEIATDRYEYAQEAGVEVHLSGMDSFRADTSFLNELVSTVNPGMFTLLDTVGIATPQTVQETLTDLNHDPSSVGVHFHRDLGVATANVLEAANHGVGKADVTVGGIGDRVGNTALEEVVVAGTVGQPEVEFGIDTGSLIPNCRQVLDTLNEDIPPHKAILGKTAYEHESGMHTATMLESPGVYEGFDPAQFGGERQLLFGPSSGTGSARRILIKSGEPDPSDDLIQAFLDRLHDLDEHIGVDEAIEMAADTRSTNE